MHLLEERIRKDGVVKPGNVLKVDSFLNHQMDIVLIMISSPKKQRYIQSQRDGIQTRMQTEIISPLVSVTNWY